MKDGNKRKIGVEKETEESDRIHRVMDSRKCLDFSTREEEMRLMDSYQQIENTLN